MEFLMLNKIKIANSGTCAATECANTVTIYFDEISREWTNILPRDTLTSHDTCEATTIDSTSNLVFANITAGKMFLNFEGRSTGGMWTALKKKRDVTRTHTHTQTRQTARWATSRVSRGRIQPYIGVDTGVPTEPWQRAIQRASRKYMIGKMMGKRKILCMYCNTSPSRRICESWGANKFKRDS